MPSEHSGMEESCEVDETNEIHLSTNNFGTIFKMKQSVAVENGECAETTSGLTSILKKKNIRKEGHDKDKSTEAIPKKKRNPVDSVHRRLVKLAPKLTATTTMTNDSQQLPSHAHNSINQIEPEQLAPPATYCHPVASPPIRLTNTTSALSTSASVGVTSGHSTSTILRTVFGSYDDNSSTDRLQQNRDSSEQQQHRHFHVSPQLPGQLVDPPADLVNRQIISGVLPPFAPLDHPPARFDIQLPSDGGYRCVDCQDRFLLATSLSEHLRRRSVFIGFECASCACLLTFYNRCSLLAHVREHAERDEARPDVRQATLAPLPHELVPAVQHSSANNWQNSVIGFLNDGGSSTVSDSTNQQQRATIDARTVMAPIVRVTSSSSISSILANSLTAPISNVSNPSTSSSILASCLTTSTNSIQSTSSIQASSSIPATSTTLVTATSVTSSPIVAPPVLASQTNSPSHKSSGSSSDAIVYPYRCSECKLKFVTPLQFRKHFSGELIEGAAGGGGASKRPYIDANLQCKACSLICTSRCSLSAHRRSHQMRRPFVCPECGQQIVGTWVAFERHVTLTCFHPSRTIGFECPQCQATSPTPDRLRRHLETKHEVASFVKCLACPMAFKNREAFRGHRREAHDDDAEVRGGVIFKCPLCEVVFQKEGGMREHLDGHFTKLGLPLKMAKYLFRCPDCGELYPLKSMLARHVNDTHPHLLLTKNKKCGSTLAQRQQSSCSAGAQVAANKKEIRYRGSRGPNVDEQRGRKEPSGENDEHRDSVNRSSELENGDRGDLVEDAAGDSQDEEVDGGSRDATLELNGELADDVADTARQHAATAVAANKKRFRCDKCGCTFRTRNGTRTHASHCTGAQNEPPLTTCAVCDEQLAEDDGGRAMAAHGHAHLKDGLMVCTLCNCLPFVSKQALARHIESHALRYKYPYSCVYCLEDLADIGSANLHWRNEHGLLSFTCPFDTCDVQYLSTRSMLRHVRDVHGQDNRSFALYSCAFCLLEFATADEANDHVENAHDVAADRIDSHMVKRIFRNPAVTRKKRPSDEPAVNAANTDEDDHQSPSPPPPTPPPPPPPPAPTATKRSKPRPQNSTTQLPPIPKLTIKIEPPDNCDTLDSSPPKSKRPRLSIVSSKPSREVATKKKSAAVRAAAAAVAEEEQKCLVCAMCGHEDRVRERFVEHVRREHRTDEDYEGEEDGVQCLECGVRFAVLPSLRRHLIFSHRVRDLDRFLRTNGYEVAAGDRPDVAGETEAGVTGTDAATTDDGDRSEETVAGVAPVVVHEPSNPLECQVCGLSFETDLALKVHARTHGMAFIRSKFTNVTRGGASVASTSVASASVASNPASSPAAVNEPAGSSPAKSVESS